MPPELAGIPAWTKALQLFSLVLFFAGTFHLVHLFVVHRRAMARWEPDRKILLDQFTSMERNVLFSVNWPALLVFLVLSGRVLYARPDLLGLPFMHVLLGYMALLIMYHLTGHRMHLRLKRGEVKWSAFQLMLWAQGATLFLFVLVVLLIYRERMGWVWGSAGLLVLGAVLMVVMSSLRGRSAPTNEHA